MQFKLTTRQHHLLRALAFTLTALVLYVPANIYPFMTMKYSGQYHNTTIWDGIRTLYEENMLLTGTIVFMASMIIPVFKLIHLFSGSKVTLNSLRTLVRGGIKVETPNLNSPPANSGDEYKLLSREQLLAIEKRA